MKAIIIIILLILGGYLIWAQTDHWSESTYMKMIDKVQETGKNTCQTKGLLFSVAWIKDYDTFYLICESLSPPKLYPFEMELP